MGRRGAAPYKHKPILLDLLDFWVLFWYNINNDRKKEAEGQNGDREVKRTGMRGAAG